MPGVNRPNRDRIERLKQKSKHRTYVLSFFAILGIIFCLVILWRVFQFIIPDQPQASQEEVDVLLLMDAASNELVTGDYAAAMESLDGLSAMDAVSKDDTRGMYMNAVAFVCGQGDPVAAADILRYMSRRIPTPEVRETLEALPASDDKLALIEEMVARVRARYRLFAYDMLPEMLEVPGGDFNMGCEGAAVGRYDCEDFGDENLHSRIVDTFLMGRTEVTWRQYRYFCRQLNREYKGPPFGEEDTHPAVNVSWYDAARYANWLNWSEGLLPVYLFDGESGPFLAVARERRGYRLPSEVEWEYAAKGGGMEGQWPFSGAPELDSVGWYARNTRDERSRPVAGLLPNAFGMYDMSGNVWEWCEDWYKGYPGNEDAPNYVGTDRIIRGGSYDSEPHFCRVSYRLNALPRGKAPGTGFRVVFSEGR